MRQNTELTGTTPDERLCEHCCFWDEAPTADSAECENCSRVECTPVSESTLYSFSKFIRSHLDLQSELVRFLTGSTVSDDKTIRWLITNVLDMAERDDHWWEGIWLLRAERLFINRNTPIRLLGESCRSFHGGIMRHIPECIFDQLLALTGITDDLLEIEQDDRFRDADQETFHSRYQCGEDGLVPQKLVDDLRQALNDNPTMETGLEQLANSMVIREIRINLDIEREQAIDRWREITSAQSAPTATAPGHAGATDASDAVQPSAKRPMSHEEQTRLIHDRRYAPWEIADELKCSADTVNRYAKAAGCPTPDRGDRTFTYSADDRLAILYHAETNSGAKKVKHAACAALEQIRN